MKVINFFGGPGVGKSTVASGLVHCMKTCHILAEHAQEFAKEKIHEGAQHLLAEQNFVFAHQEHRLHILRGHADIAVSDSPLPLSIHYAPKDYPASFSRFVLDVFSGYDNVNYFIERNPSFGYQQEGRLQSQEQSDGVAAGLRALLDSNGIPYRRVQAGEELPERILADLARQRLIEIPRRGMDGASKLIERADASDALALASGEARRIQAASPGAALAPRRLVSTARLALAPRMPS